MEFDRSLHFILYHYWLWGKWQTASWYSRWRCMRHRWRCRAAHTSCHLYINWCDLWSRTLAHTCVCLNSPQTQICTDTIRCDMMIIYFPVPGDECLSIYSDWSASAQMMMTRHTLKSVSHNYQIFTFVDVMRRQAIHNVHTHTVSHIFTF